MLVFSGIFYHLGVDCSQEASGQWVLECCRCNIILYPTVIVTNMNGGLSSMLVILGTDTELY